MIIVSLIRHGKTFGNTKKRYIGKTDESILETEVEKIKNVQLPVPELLLSSPLQRCYQTAQLLFPGKNIEIMENFKECDFGEFENKNFHELSNCLSYQRWIDSGGKEPFPGGESVEEFKNRILEGFNQMLKNAEEHKNKSIVAVVHGGTIMSVMEAYVSDGRTYYDWCVENLKGYRLEIEKENNEYRVKRVSEI